MGSLGERIQGLKGRLRDRVQSLIALLSRYKRFLPFISLATGVASALLMKRGYSRIPWLLGALFVTWAVVGFVMVVGKRQAQQSEGWLGKLHFGGIVLAQSASQEVLFFILPFYYWSTSFGSPNVIFFAILVIAVVATLIDPIFEAMTKWTPLSLSLLALSNFAALNFVLPVIFGLRNNYSLHLSLLLTVVLLVLFASYATGARQRPAAASASGGGTETEERTTEADEPKTDDPKSKTETDEPTTEADEPKTDDRQSKTETEGPKTEADAAEDGRRRWRLKQRLIFAGVLSLAMMLGTWLFDLQVVVPPAPLRIVDGTACDGVVDKEPLNRRKTFSVAAGLPDRIFCFTAIGAPRGLDERIIHRWIKDGEVLNDVELKQISGGRLEGYRTWSLKSRFPKERRGDWVCEVRTGGGQVVGRVPFEIVD